MNKERPILFSGPMVRAILEGRKTMTRRIVKPQPLWEEIPTLCNDGIWRGRYRILYGDFDNPLEDAAVAEARCPYGQPGDKLWVRETWRIPNGAPRGWVDYRADDAREGFRWRPSIYMPRWASRITLEITDIRIERMLDISEEDARLEGIDIGGFRSSTEGIAGREHRIKFRELWESINGPGSWDANPWVWAIEFKRIEQAGKAEGRQG